MHSRRAVSWILVVVATLGAAACVNDGPTVVSPLEPAISLAISPNPAPALSVGQTISLTAIVSGSSAGVIWSSSDSTRVAVNAATGVATCVSAGVALITAVAWEDGTAKATVLISCTPLILIGVSPTSLSFTHVVGTSPCPQAIGTVRVTNTSGEAVVIALTGHSALSVDTGVSTFAIAAGGTRDIAVSFNCSTQTSFLGSVTITATAGASTDVKVVTVTGTITR